MLSDLEIRKWLFRVCINEAKDLLKSSWRKKRCSLVNNSINTIVDNQKNIIEILQDISPEYRIPICLYYYEGYKISEIANILKKSDSTIKIKLSKGKEILKKELER